MKKSAQNVTQGEAQKEVVTQGEAQIYRSLLSIKLPKKHRVPNWKHIKGFEPRPKYGVAGVPYLGVRVLFMSFPAVCPAEGVVRKLAWTSAASGRRPLANYLADAVFFVCKAVVTAAAQDPQQPDCQLSSCHPITVVCTHRQSHTWDRSQGKWHYFLTRPSQ